MVVASLLFALVTAIGGGGPSLEPSDIELRAARTGDLPIAPGAIGDLSDRDVLVVDMTSFRSRSDTSVVQCEWPSGKTSCVKLLDVATDGSGRARFLVRLRAEVAGVDCATALRSCILAVFGGDRRAVVVTVFGAPAPEPVAIGVSPTRAARGERVEVTVEHLRAAAEVSVVLCSPGPAGPTCGPALGTITAGPDGRGSVATTVADGCAPRQPCGIALVLEGDTEPFASTSFAVTGSANAASTASYDGKRLAAGLVSAAALGLIVLLLLWRTDWRSVQGDPFAGIELPDDPFA